MAAYHGRGEGTGDAWRRLRRGLAADLSRAPIYRQLLLRGPAPSGLAAALAPRAPGDPERAQDLAAGAFVHGDERVDAQPADTVWDATPPSPAFRAWLHRFDWLDDVGAGDDDAAALARTLVDGWIARYGRWDAAAWSPEIIGHRTLRWLAAAPILFDTVHGDVAARLDALARQARYLERAAETAGDGLARLTCALALAATGACLADSARLLDAGLARLGEELESQILPDGGHVGRSPATVASLLADLHALDGLLSDLDREAPEAVHRAMDRMAPMVRFFQMSDGGLAAFHGGGEGDRALIDAVLACADAEARAFGYAPHTGYHRVEADGAVLILDAGAPASGDFGREAHASALAFEFSAPSGRLIVNCGWSPGQPNRFREAIRATAAHSTLVVDDASSARLDAAVGPLEALRGRRGAASVAARRNEEELGVWLDASHEGYRASHGVVHRRRIFVSAKGGDVRAEDTLFRPVEDAPSLVKTGLPYAIRFHLHPTVRTSLARDGRSALLILPNGEGWRFRTDTGPVGVEESVYLAAGGGAQRSRQLVLRGVADPDAPVDRPPNRARWALQRIGRAPSL